jgi:hypothetical protein
LRTDFLSGNWHTAHGMGWTSGPTRQAMIELFTGLDHPIKVNARTSAALNAALEIWVNPAETRRLWISLFFEAGA